MSKVRDFLSKHRISTAVATGATTLAATVGSAFAVDPTTSGWSEEIIDGVETVTNSVRTAFDIGTIAEIIGIVLGACVGLFLFWWGARKVVRMVSSAFRKGKISL